MTYFTLFKKRLNPKTAMGNPNSFNGQIYDKRTCRGPKQRLFLQI